MISLPPPAHLPKHTLPVFPASGVTPPLRIESSSPSVVEGQTLDLNCVVTGQPGATVVWYKRGGALPPTHQVWKWLDLVRPQERQPPLPCQAQSLAAAVHSCSALLGIPPPLVFCSHLALEAKNSFPSVSLDMSGCGHPFESVVCGGARWATPTSRGELVGVRGHT